MESLTEPARPATHPAVMIGGLAFAVVIQMTVSLLTLVVPVIATEIAKGRGLSIHLLAFYLPIVYTTAFFANFLVPKLLPRFGGAGLGLACIAVATAGLALMLPASMASTLAAPITLGLALGGVTPATCQIVGPFVSSRTAGLIMSVRQSAISAGGLLAGIILPLLAIYWGWHALLPVGFASLTLAVLLLPTLHWFNDRSVTSLAAQHPLAPIKQLLAMRGMPQLLSAVFADLMMVQCLRTFFTVYLAQDLGFGLAIAGLMFAASQLAGIIGQFACAIISDRWIAPRAVLAINGLLITLTAIAAACFTREWPIAAIATVAVVLGFGATGSPPVMLGEIARRSPPGQVGILISGGNLAIMAGSALGPLVFGAAAILFGYPGGLVALAICALAGAVVAAPPSFKRPFGRVADEAGASPSCNGTDSVVAPVGALRTRMSQST